MKTLDDHIEEQNKWDEDGQGRSCFMCHADYYITPGREDACGCCLDCAQGAVRDALRYRWLRERRDNPHVFIGFVGAGGISQFTGPAADNVVDAAMTVHAQRND